MSANAVFAKMEEISKPKAPDTPTTKADATDKPDVAAVLADIKKRMDAIEGARPAPDSEGDNSDDSTNVKKNFWNNVL